MNSMILSMSVVKKMFPDAHSWKSWFKEGSLDPRDLEKLWNVQESHADNNLLIGYGPTEEAAWEMARLVVTVLHIRGKRPSCGATPEWDADGGDVTCTLPVMHTGPHTSLMSPSWEGDHRFVIHVGDKVYVDTYPLHSDSLSGTMQGLAEVLAVEPVMGVGCWTKAFMHYYVKPINPEKWVGESPKSSFWLAEELLTKVPSATEKLMAV